MMSPPANDQSHVDGGANRVSPVLPQRYVRNEIRTHVIFLTMATVVLAMSFLMRTEGRTNVYLPGFSNPMPESCTAQRMLGFDCPGCGLTRSFISISHGRWSRAWFFNPAGFAIYAFLAVQIPWHLMQIMRLRNNRLPISTPWVFVLPVLVVVMLSANWIGKMWWMLTLGL